jgi:hypothetical protein
MQLAKVIVTPLKTVLTVLTVLITLIVSPAIAIAAATCPIGQFDGTSVIPDAMNDGLVITRSAQKITGAPLFANTRYANVSGLTPAQVSNRIDSLSCAYDMNGDGKLDTVDSTVIVRHLLGLKNDALTAGLTLGSGLRPNPQDVTNFIANGCIVTTPCTPKTYYISPTGSDTAAGTDAAPWRTFTKAFSTMASGEWLIVKNGTYTESLGSATQPPAGTPGKLTTIRAETDGGAVIDGQGSVIPLVLTNAYVRIEGMKFINGESSVASLDGNNLHILRSAFANAGTSTFDQIVEVSGNDVLLEDSWMWGRGKGGVFVIGARATLRRLVIRLDYYTGTLGYIGVALSNIYDTQIGADNTVIENVIVLDFGMTSSSFDWKGGFRSRDPLISERRTHRYFGTIALNLPYDGYRMSDSNYENVVAWNVSGRGGLYEDSFKTGYTIKNATVGVSASAGILTDQTSVSNSIVYRATGPNSPGAYNVYNQTALPSGATNTITSDPQIKYITRVENNSTAFGSGQNGVNRGATIVNRYQDGVLTNIPLWPWPNEARIKADFQTNFGLPGVNPRRGFAADTTRLNGAPLTLSSYIWEYLGNPCPTGMCD